MSSIDERIVEMKFKNGDFQTGVKSTLDSLTALKKGLDFKGATQGLSELNAASGKMNFGPLGAAVEGVSKRFMALATIGVTALANITTAALNTGAQIAKSLTIDPPSQGYDEYELKLGSIQTIMAGTGDDLETVNSALDELNTYADKTIYSFSDMTSNIGKFTNAGVELDRSVAAIQGVANVAAISGANSNEASRAMYNFSQALSIGYVGLMDWKSIELANMGTSEFRQQLIDSAVAMGTLTEAGEGTWKTLQGTEVTVENFRNTLNDQWLTSEALTETLGKYSDVTTDIGKRASAAATEVKTFTHLLDTLQEAAGSGWAQTFELVIGDFEEAKALWTSVNDVVGGIIDGQSDRRNAILGDWKEEGGRAKLIQALGNAFEGLANIIKPIRKAFEGIFPPMTGRRLFELTVAFEHLTRNFKIGVATGGRIARVFKGIFAVFSVGIEIVKQIAGAVFNFVKSLSGVSGGNGGLLEMSATVGDILVKFQEWAVKGKGIERMFDSLNRVVTRVMKPLAMAIRFVGDALTQLFNGDVEGFKATMGKAGDYFAATFRVAFGAVSDLFGDLGGWADKARDRLREMGDGALGPLTSAIDWILKQIGRIADALSFSFDFKFGSGDISDATKETSKLAGAWDLVKTTVSKLASFFGPILSEIRDFLAGVVESFTGWVKNLTFTDALAAINTGVLVSVALMVKGFIDTLKDAVSGLGDIAESITGAFDQLTDTLKTMQQQVKAQMILMIAMAVGILAASLWLLAKIDGDKLAIALTGLGAVFATMIGALALLQSFNLTKNVGIITTAAGLVLLAVAVGILVSAVKRLSDMDWQGMIKGLVGVGALLVGLALFTQMAKVSKGGLRQSAGLILLAVAIGILSFAVEKIGKMDTKTIVKGITALGLMLVGLAAIVTVMGKSKGIFAGSAGILVLSVAILALYFAMKQFIKIDWKDFAKGMGMVAIALAAVGLALLLIPITAIAQAAALLVVAAALTVLADVLLIFGNMGWGQIAKAGVVLAGLLALLVAGLMLMTGTLLGSAALVVAAGALAVLAIVLKTLGEMSWQSILLALGALAGVFIILAAAGLLMAPALPVLAALAVIIGVLGVAALVAGVGVLAFATAFAILAAAGAAGVAVLVAAFRGVIELIPVFAENVANGLVSFATIIRDNAPIIVGAFSAIMSSLLTEAEKLVPQVLSLIETMLLGVIDLVVKLTPDFAQAGFDMLIAFLTKIRDNLGEVVDLVFDIIDEFIESMERNRPRIDRIGRKVMNWFSEAIGNKLSELWNSFLNWGIDVAKNLVDGVVQGINNGIDRVRGAAANLGKHAYGALKLASLIFSPSRKWMYLGNMMGEGAAVGIEKSIGSVEKSSAEVGHSAYKALKQTLSSMSAILEDDLDLNPVIAPVVDLSEVNGLVKTLGAIPAPKVGLDLRRSSKRAEEVRRQWGLGWPTNPTPDKPQVPVENRTEVSYVQNIQSPQALSTADIYRHTRSQLASLRHELR